MHTPTRMKNAIIRVFTLFAIASAAPAWAQRVEPPIAQTANTDKPHWHFRNVLQARNNRLGAGINFEARWRMPLYDGPESMLLKGSRVDIGAIARVSPASVHHAVFVDYIPIAPLQLRLDVGRLAYLGLFGTVVEYDGPDADWSDEAISNNRPNADPGAGIYWRALARLRLKFGPIVALHDQLFMSFNTSALGTGTYWYESTNDLLIGNPGSIWVMKNTLGYLLYGNLKREFLVIAGHHERYQTTQTDIQRQIAGVVSLYRPRYDWWGHPQFVLLAGAMVEDVYRAGSLYIGGQIITTFDLY